MTLIDRIMALAAGASQHKPIQDIAIIGELMSPEYASAQILCALNNAVDTRLLNTARITRAGVTNDLYWPTGRKTPALSGIKPMEPHIVPNPTQPDTYGSRLLKAIVAHGPLIGADLAAKSGIPAKNIDPYLVPAIKNGSVATRMGWVSELGKERKHYMTATQAQEWDERSEKIEVEPVAEPGGGHVMNHPLAQEAAASIALDGDTHYADEATLARLHELEDSLAENRSTIHALRNDVAARDLILNNIAGILKVVHIEDIPGALDDLIHALATRAMTAQRAPGKPALLLIDSGDLTEIEMLSEDDNAQRIAMNSIEHGDAARVLVVRIIGEAKRQVEWKEAA